MSQSPAGPQLDFDLDNRRSFYLKSDEMSQSPAGSQLDFDAVLYDCASDTEDQKSQSPAGSQLDFDYPRKSVMFLVALAVSQSPAGSQLDSDADHDPSAPDSSPPCRNPPQGLSSTPTHCTRSSDGVPGKEWRNPS